MLNSIQGMRLVFDTVKGARDNNAPMNDEEIQNLLAKLVVDETIRNRYKNFEKGYAAEELFRRIYSLLPWVELITPLGQEQYPEESKKRVQVPDYEIVYEVGTPDNKSRALIEVKLVSGEKQTLNIKKHQYVVLHKYELEVNTPLIFAIFWQKFRIWTLNSIKSFTEKNSEFKISYAQACRNDLSAIMGDYTYLFRKRPYRKSLYSNIEEKREKVSYLHTHAGFGKTIYEGVSLDGKIYTDLSILEPAVLDCAFTFEECMHRTMEDSTVELIEQLNNKLYVYKLSSLLLGFLQKIYCYDNDSMYYNNNDIVTNSFNIVDGIRQKCGGERFYLMPYDRNEDSDRLIKQQFGNVSHIYNSYCTAKRENNYLLLVSHM